MPAYYLDTSALVKRYAKEVGSAWITQLTDIASDNEIYSALHVEERRRAGGEPSLTFVSADGEQLSAAAAAGLQIEDPNQHA